MRLIRMAVESGFRPTSLVLRQQPHSKWTDVDFIMFEAYKIYEAEHSTSHGDAVYIARSGDASLNTLVKDRTDILDESLQIFDDKNGKKKNPPKGVIRWAELVYVDPETGERAPVPRGGLARARYLKMQQEQLELEAAGLLDESLDVQTERPVTGYNPAEYGDGM